MDDSHADAIERHRFLVLLIYLGCAADKFGARWSQIRATAGCCIVPVTGSRRPRMKVFRLPKVLPDEARANNLAVHRHKAAISARRENKLRYTRHDTWINQSGQYREGER